MSNSEKIQVLMHTSPSYKKCGLCGKAKDLPFKVLIYSATLVNRLQGEVDACRACAENLGTIVGLTLPGNEVVKKFDFE